MIFRNGIPLLASGPSTTRTLLVRAHSLGGWGPWSATATVTTAPPEAGVGQLGADQPTELNHRRQVDRALVLAKGDVALVQRRREEIEVASLFDVRTRLLLVPVDRHPQLPRHREQPPVQVKPVGRVRPAARHPRRCLAVGASLHTHMHRCLGQGLRLGARLRQDTQDLAVAIRMCSHHGEEVGGTELPALGALFWHNVARLPRVPAIWLKRFRRCLWDRRCTLGCGTYAWRRAARA